MFNPKTEKIKNIFEYKKDVIKNIEKLFIGNINVYIDFANVKPWAEKLHWNIDIKRLSQFLESFDNIKEVKFYQRELEGDEKSKKEIEIIKSLKL